MNKTAYIDSLESKVICPYCGRVFLIDLAGMSVLVDKNNFVRYYGENGNGKFYMACKHTKVAKHCNWNHKQCNGCSNINVCREENWFDVKVGSVLQRLAERIKNEGL